jgi:hypothetical protein
LGRGQIVTSPWIMTAHILTAPIPPYQNVPAQPQFYKPSRFVISAIALGQFTTITTNIDMNYVIGQLIRLIIPATFGTRQLNEMTGYVVSIPSANQIEVAIDSSRFDPFIASSAPTQAQIVAVGDINNGYQAINGRTIIPPNIPGAFTNISPL